MVRVELIYTPGCSTYKRALNTLETVIAEERLPIHVEMVEAGRNIVNAPRIRIDGHDISELPQEPNGDYCRIYDTKQGLSAIPCIESLRSLIWRKWKELTEEPLLGS